VTLHKERLGRGPPEPLDPLNSPPVRRRPPRAAVVRWNVASTRWQGPPLFVEPDVFQTRTVGDAVDHDRQPLHPSLPASRAAVVKDDRSGAILRQLPFDLPDQLLALFLVGLDRLSVDQLVDCRTAVTVIVQLAAAPVIQVEVLVGIGPASYRAEPNGETEDLSDSLRISEADFPPNILRSIGAGGGIPSKVSYRCNARVSRSESRVIAAAITLPPRQTPHSTISPDIFDRATYRTAWQSADIRSLLVIVKGRTFAMISATHGSTSVKPSDADVGSFRILRNSTPATLSTRFTKPAVVDLILMERIHVRLKDDAKRLGQHVILHS